ncbi:MAG: NADH-quinone oxidoreductase subunit A [Planctomycetota bacterium]|nr:NADH-quinone oxidoreductase subunit A [Planctomycetota bacterium]
MVLAEIDLQSYAPLALVIVMAVGFAIINVVASLLLGPSADGVVKGLAYESGMNPFGTARKRFNIRFYIMAMTFLIFDVEIIFLYPWAVAFSKLEPASAEASLFLARIGFFVGTSVIAYIYAWKKGVFRWD